MFRNKTKHLHELRKNVFIREFLLIVVFEKVRPKSAANFSLVNKHVSIQFRSKYASYCFEFRFGRFKWQSKI